MGGEDKTANVLMLIIGVVIVLALFGVPQTAITIVTNWLITQFVVGGLVSYIIGLLVEGLGFGWLKLITWTVRIGPFTFSFTAFTIAVILVQNRLGL